MKHPFRKANPTELKAVFSVTVDFNWQYRKDRNDDSLYLQPGGRYYFKKQRDENGVTYENLGDFVTGVLIGDLNEVCNQHLDAPIKIAVNGKYDGSLVLVFSAIFNAIQFVSCIVYN
jgi:hypothetical protein